MRFAAITAQLRRPAALAGALFFALGAGIVANALFLQPRPHPAPLVHTRADSEPASASGPEIASSRAGRACRRGAGCAGALGLWTAHRRRRLRAADARRDHPLPARSRPAGHRRDQRCAGGGAARRRRARARVTACASARISGWRRSGGAPKRRAPCLDRPARRRGGRRDLRPGRSARRHASISTVRRRKASSTKSGRATGCSRRLAAAAPEAGDASAHGAGGAVRPRSVAGRHRGQERDARSSNCARGTARRGSPPVNHHAARSCGSGEYRKRHG